MHCKYLFFSYYFYDNELFPQENYIKPGVVAQACNPRYSESGSQEDHNSEARLEKKVQETTSELMAGCVSVIPVI
jgi:hypothetical protein